MQYFKKENWRFYVLLKVIIFFWINYLFIRFIFIFGYLLIIY